MAMLVKAANAITGGGLGYPSKMPGTSYGLPAQACKTGAKLAKVEGSVCSDCYAMKGNYQFRDVKKAQANRLASITDAQWSSAMAMLILRAAKATDDGAYHRWHDSGDIQSVEHLAKIVQVAKLTPKVKHWVPTKENGYLQRYVAAGGIIPDNLIVRVSATMVDGPATKTWAHTSGVHTGETAPTGETCPAPKQDNKCGPCRKCWDKSVPHVSYHKH